MPRLGEGEKSIVRNVYAFFQLEKSGGRRDRGAAKSLAVRTAMVGKIATSTAHNLRRHVSGKKQDKTRGRLKSLWASTRGASSGGKSMGFYSKRDHPTVDKVVALCKEEADNFPKMSWTTFWRGLKSIGFHYVQTKGNTQLMMERTDIVAWRRHFLCRIREIRRGGRPIVYLDETWINAHHTVSRKWWP
eukprot:scpid75083/ scgid3082/ 